MRFRRAAKVDEAQESIVNGLRKMGVKVYPIRWPCDLALLYWSNKAQTFLWQLAELKTPTKTGKRRKRKDQQEQDQFLSETSTPVWLTLDEAISWLKEH